MSAQPTLKRLLLRAGDSPHLARLAHRHGMRLGASRWVAGETLQQVDAVLRRLNDQGLGAATALFDAPIRTREAARAQAAEYEAAIGHLAAARIDGYVGIKLSHLGLGFGDPGAALANTTAIARFAASHGQFVRIEMEQSRYVSDTLNIYRQVRAAGLHNCGLTLQSYLRRTSSDLEQLLDLSPNLRLVKGAYLERPPVSYPRHRDTDTAYACLLRTALQAGGYTAIATHDEKLIQHALQLARELPLPRERFAFEMLYGVRQDLAQQLAHAGHRVIIAAPYGPDWFPYLTRRLAERPANLAFLVHNAIRR
jgi:proline dehydrogenase